VNSKNLGPNKAGLPKTRGWLFGVPQSPNRTKIRPI